MMTSAPSESSDSVTADPIPPEPPARITCLPLSDSVECKFLLQRQVAAGNYDKKHREHLAIAEVQFNEPLRHRRQHDGDPSVKKKSPITRSRRQRAKTPPEIHQNLDQHPKKNQHGWDSALGGIV